MKLKAIRENLYKILFLIFFILLSCVLIKTNIYASILSFDNKVFQFLSYFVDEKTNVFFRIITEFGNIYIPITIIMLLLIFLEDKLYCLLQILSYSVVGFISLIIKFIIARPRPEFALIKLPITYSFPSGHAMTSLVFYLTLCYLLTRKSSKTTKVVCYTFFSILVLFIGISRIYLGVHYFSDVVGGYIFGTIIFLIIKNIFDKKYKEVLL